MPLVLVHHASSGWLLIKDDLTPSGDYKNQASQKTEKAYPIMIDRFYTYYIALWASASFIAAVMVIRSHESYAITRREYWRFLNVPWKLITFAVAGAGTTLIAPYSGDPTWDYVDGVFMSVLAFTTSPWTVGALYRAASRRLPLSQAYVAAVVWMLSASWLYDLYILLRDGVYPATWFSNIFASSVIYAAAGLLWNLEWRTGRGVTFAFMEDDWLAPSSERGFGRIYWMAAPFILFAAILTLHFVRPMF